MSAAEGSYDVDIIDRYYTDKFRLIADCFEYQEEVQFAEEVGELLEIENSTVYGILYTNKGYIPDSIMDMLQLIREIYPEEFGERIKFAFHMILEDTDFEDIEIMMNYSLREILQELCEPFVM